MAFVALTTAVSLEAFRVLFPKAYGLADREGNEVAAVAMVAVFGSSLLTPIVRRLLRPGRALVLAVGALAIWRLSIPLFDEVPLALSIFGAMVALLVLTLVLTSGHPGGMEVTGVALLAGLALDVALRSAFVTWDPVWHRGAGPVLVAVLLSGALAVSAVIALGPAWRGTGAGTPAIGDFGSGVALGAFLALEVLFVLSPGFVASSAGISISWSALVVLGGIALALATFGVSGRDSPAPVVLGAAALLAATGFLLPGLSGGSVVLAVVAAQGAGGVVLAGAARSRTSSPLRAELGVGLGWVVFVMVLLLYQIHFDQPLPFDNRWVVAGAGALTALAALGRLPRATSPSLAQPAFLTAACVLVVALVLSVGLTVTNGADATVASRPDGSLRIVEWNIRQSVTEGQGDLDPERVASVLAREGTPDIVVLPEAARGWPSSADLDIASWLSRRLGLPFAWAPAADHQFGTLLLTRLPIVSTRMVKLPVAGRSQGRSLLYATLDVGNGEHLTVLATHLQHRNDQTSRAARMEEIRVILDQWKGARHTVLVGDFNPSQGDPPRYPPRRPGDFAEIRAFLDAGFTANRDLATCSQPTSGRNCSDFVLVTPDLRQEVNVLADISEFDHRPVVSRIQLT